jgi:hypothetical protein
MAKAADCGPRQLYADVPNAVANLEKKAATVRPGAILGETRCEICIPRF